MSPEPLLAAVEDYRGTIVDLDRGLTVSPAVLAAGRRALARRMAELGLEAGDRAILAVGNGPMFIAAWAAILMRGGSPILIHMETPPAELKRIARQFKARFALTDARTEDELAGVGAAAAAIDGDPLGRAAWADFGDVDFRRHGAFCRLPGVPLHPTSGTASRPRVAVRPAATALAEARHYVETIGVDRHDTLLAMAPMSHAYAHGWCVVTPMLTGAAVATMRRFNPKLVFQACEQLDITIMPAVAAMLDVLLFGAGDRLYNPARRVITGGAPLSDRTARNFEKISGSRVRPLFGTTETGAIAVARPGDPLITAGRVGRPFDGVDVDIRIPGDPSDFGEGLGLVHVRSPSVMAGYLSDETIDASPLVDGWFNTGDLGWFDDDGALHLRGRQAEVVNIAGMKVLPAEVEEVIAAMPGVVEVKVYARKSGRGAHHLRAAVVADDGIDAGRVKAHCEEHLIYYKRPARVILVDALPRSSGGKILRDELP